MNSAMRWWLIGGETLLTIFLALLAMCWLVKYSEKLQWYDEGTIGVVVRQRFSPFPQRNSTRQQTTQCPTARRLQQVTRRSATQPVCQTSPRTPHRGFWEDVQLAALQRQLLNRVQQRSDVVERLLVLERVKNPGKSERWYMEKVLYDLRRGR